MQPVTERHYMILACQTEQILRRTFCTQTPQSNCQIFAIVYADSKQIKEDTILVCKHDTDDAQTREVSRVST